MSGSKLCIHTTFIIDDKWCESVNLDLSELLFYTMNENGCWHKYVLIFIEYN